MKAAGKSGKLVKKPKKNSAKLQETQENMRKSKKKSLPPRFYLQFTPTLEKHPAQTTGFNKTSRNLKEFPIPLEQNPIWKSQEFTPTKNTRFTHKEKVSPGQQKKCIF